MAKTEFIFSKVTATIRLMPQNYVVAAQQGRRWLADVDKAVDTEAACAIFETIFASHNLTWGPGCELAKELNRVFDY